MTSFQIAPLFHRNPPYLLPGRKGFLNWEKARIAFCEKSGVHLLNVIKMNLHILRALLGRMMGRYFIITCSILNDNLISYQQTILTEQFHDDSLISWPKVQFFSLYARHQYDNKMIWCGRNRHESGLVRSDDFHLLVVWSNFVFMRWPE